MNIIFSTFQEQVNLFFKEVLVVQEEIVLATNEKIENTLEEHKGKPVPPKEMEK